jgi:Uncharacterized alpha/beta hydrolase domain (DUF2235)
MSEAGKPSSAEAGQVEVADPACAGTASLRGRRNIVLLSDGTGNSPAKLNKTNVWRLYQALDLGAGDQIAFYDDGVGTSGFRPLQILGGAVGWGLSRNVRDLYEFLCRHYREGDHIYVFGFSRGAFTARTLAALIAQCGVLDCSKCVPRRGGEEISLNTRAGLKAGVKLAYKSYRRGYSAPVARLTRWLRDLLLGPIPSPEAFRRAYSIDRDADGDEQRIGIEFVGVWDTVDAVGLPVDELSTMIDRIFYPHRFPDQDLSPRVARACHGIAMDDERYTFHPVLWNERGTADSERITQVWFAGMHSDVGGGYPDNDLAQVSLEWMIDQVRFDPVSGCGLRFAADDLRAIAHRAQPLGKVHDSRRGLGVYYRYKPRHVASLCNDPDNGVLIAEPKIHEAVFERIAENTTGYAPPGLPASYRLVDAHGAVSDPDPTTYESADQRQTRARLLERAQDHIFWRRVLYYMFVFATLALVFMPYYRPPIRGAEPEGWLESALSWLLGWLPAFLPGFVSSWASYWTDAWSQSPFWFLVLAALYGWLLWHSRKVDANIHRLSEVAWWHVKQCAGPMPAIPGVGTFESVAGRWRGARKLKRFHRLSVKVAVPVLAVVVAAYLAVGTIYRIAYHLPGVGDGVCRKWFDALGADAEEPRQWGPGAWSKEIRFDTQIPCIDTGLTLRAGQKYVIEVKDQKNWTDGDYAAEASGLSGLGHLLNPVFVAGVPSRRSLLLPWFSLTGEIGRDSGYTFPLYRERVTVRPAQSGRLYLYVNDAINVLGTELGFDPQAIDGFPIGEEERRTGRSAAWYAYYLNNGGTATITVRPDR